VGKTPKDREDSDDTEEYDIQSVALPKSPNIPWGYKETRSGAELHEAWANSGKTTLSLSQVCPSQIESEELEPPLLMRWPKFECWGAAQQRAVRACWHEHDSEGEDSESHMSCDGEVSESESESDKDEVCWSLERRCLEAHRNGVRTSIHSLSVWRSPKQSLDAAMRRARVEASGKHVPCNKCIPTTLHTNTYKLR
jgi:hypothetical protein